MCYEQDVNSGTILNFICQKACLLGLGAVKITVDPLFSSRNRLGPTRFFLMRWS